MREIGLFKAKRIDNGEWVEGYYWSNGLGNHFIKVIKDKNGNFVSNPSENDYEIDENTISQYTGLKDKNGNKIFENYILDYWENGKENIKQILKVFYENGQFVVDHYAINLLNSRNMSSEIIGNIFDNPELLTKE